MVIPEAREFARPQTPMDLLSFALHNNAAIDVIERLAALQEKQLAREAELHFNEALNRVQQKIKRIAPDLDNPQTRSKYASYAAIDRVIRPIYSTEGFSLAFTHADTPRPDHIRVIARLALGSHKEMFQIDMPADGKGAKGGDVMTKTHATAAGDSYAKRYLVKDIFNVAIGEDDRDGNETSGEMSDLSEAIEWIANAKDMAELKKLYDQAKAAALEAKDSNAIKAIVAAKDARKAELA